MFHKNFWLIYSFFKSLEHILNINSLVIQFTHKLLISSVSVFLFQMHHSNELVDEAPEASPATHTATRQSPEQE